jgi:selenide, water dikinase
LVGRETGDDAAVYSLTDETALVSTTDFITPVCDDPYLFGQVAAANALSDVYAMGGRPLIALAICAFPEELASETAAAICAGGEAKVTEAGATVVGGHTVRNPELFYGLAVTGLISPKEIVRNVGARVGDLLVLTKPLGTGIMINAFRQGKVGEEELLETCRAMARLNARPSEVMRRFEVHAATDVTGFGLVGHALGMAKASGVGMRIWSEHLPTFPGVIELIDSGVTSKGAKLNRKAFAADVGFAGDTWGARETLPFDPQTAGGLLAAVAPGQARELLDALGEVAPAATIIGEVVEQPPAGNARFEMVPAARKDGL